MLHLPFSVPRVAAKDKLAIPAKLSGHVFPLYLQMKLLRQNPGMWTCVRRSVLTSGRDELCPAEGRKCESSGTEANGLYNSTATDRVPPKFTC